MGKYKLINNVLGWVVFLIASTVYLMTMEPTASFWDCGEFISSAYKLEVGHPPGAPFFMLTANLFTQFASDPSKVAVMVNTMSALFSGLTILFLFWSITHLARKIIVEDDKMMCLGQMITIMGCGLVGSLAYTFSDTFWFSAVEGEVYAYFSMTENQILDFVQQYGSLKKAMEHLDKVELTMSNGKTYSSLGKVDAISGTIDEGTGAISLRAVFSNPDQFLRNGGSGTVVVPTVKKQCIIIPQAATYELQNRIFVYKVVDSKAQSAPVEVFRLNNGTEYVVEDGLAPGDVIIAEGAGLVREGTIIKSGSTKE